MEVIRPTRSTQSFGSPQTPVIFLERIGKKVVLKINLQVKENPREVAEASADLICSRIAENPALSISFATGKTPLLLYEVLAERVRSGSVSFKQAAAFHLDEFLGISSSHPASYSMFLQQRVVEPLRFEKQNVFFMNGAAPNPDEEASKYEELIKKRGINLQILGIGINGHIGFNEPGASFDSVTRIVELEETSRVDNSWLFNSIDEVPTHALTMGVKTILSAHELLFIATGASKGSIVQKAFNNEISEQVPASVLKLHPNVTAFIDREADNN